VVGCQQGVEGARRSRTVYWRGERSGDHFRLSNKIDACPGADPAPGISEEDRTKAIIGLDTQ